MVKYAVMFAMFRYFGRMSYKMVDVWLNHQLTSLFDERG
jgi:hypothetical protein